MIKFLGFVFLWGLVTTQLSAVDSKLVYGETGRLSTFDPYTHHEVSGQRLSDLIFESLIKVGPGNSYEAQLAEKWEVDASNMSVLFTLKNNVYWHSSKKDPQKRLVPQDIATTVSVISNQNSEIPNIERFRALAGVDILSSNTLRVRLKWPMFDPLSVMTFKVLPSFLVSANQPLLRKDDFAKNPIGTGPYRFIRANKMGEVLLRKHAAYHGNQPKIEEVVMKVFSDRDVMAQSLMFNAIDLVTYTSPSSLSEIQGDKNLRTVGYDALSYSFLALNHRNEFLRNKTVRKAMAHAINRNEMLEAFFSGNGVLITGPFPPSSWAYNLGVKSIEFDPSKAKEMLKSTGYSDNDGDGFLESNSGKKLSLDFKVPVSGEGESIKRLVLAIKSYLKEVGVDVQLSFLDWSVWKQKVLGEHSFDLTIGSWAFDDSSNITSLFHSSSAKPWGNNFVSFNNQDVDALLTEANATNDFEKRRVIYQKLHGELAEEMPYIFLWSLKHHASYNKKLSGVHVDANTFFGNIARWEVSK